MIGFEKYKDYDPETERAVLGVFLLEPQTFGLVYGMLNNDCFYVPHHEQAFKFIEGVFRKGLPVDLITVTRQAYDAGITEINGENTGYYFTKLTQGVVTSANIETWCMILRELAAHRELIHITKNGLKSDDVLENAVAIQERIKKVLDIRTSDDWLHISKVIMKQQKHMDDVRGKEDIGITTANSQLDRVNGGFREAQMIILAARPGVGKSAYMGRMIVRAANKGFFCGVISLEMADKDISSRMTASASGVPFYAIDRNELTEETQRNTVYATMGSLSKLPIFFSDTAQVNIHDIRAKAEKLKRKHGLDILFIDYLQLVEPENEKNKNREQEVSKISRGIKTLAMTLKIPIVVLAQLNREAADKKPELHHLRESGSLEQDADIVMFLHRDAIGANEDKTLSNNAELIVRKWRNGTPMELKIGFEPETMKFYEPSEELFKQSMQGQPEYYNPRAGITRDPSTPSEEFKMF